MNKKIILLILGIFLLPASVFAGLSNGSLLGYYSFEEAASPYLSIGTSNANSLSGSTAPTRVAGIITYGQSFDGGGNCVYGTHSDYSNIADTFSVSFWVKTADPQGGSYATILGRGTWSSGGWDFRSKEPGNRGIVVFEQNSLSGNSIQTSETDVLTTDTWRHVVGVIDSGDRYIYVDGALSDDDTYSNTNPTSSAIFSIGCRNNNDRYADVVVDEVSIWSTALTASNVTYLYNGGAPGSAQQPPFSGAAQPINGTNASQNIVGPPTNFIYNLTYNSGTGIVNYNWTDLQQTMNRSILEIYYLGNTTYILNETYVNTSHTAGVILANVSGLVEQNYTVRALAYLIDFNRSWINNGNGTLVDQLWIEPLNPINGTVYNIEYPEGPMWGFFIVGTMIIMAATYNPAVAVAFGVAGLFITTLLGFIEMSMSSISIITLMAAVLIWGMRIR